MEEILDRSFGERFVSLETPVDSGIVSSCDLLQYLDARPDVQALSSHQIRYPLPAAPGYLFFDICFLRDPIDRLRSFYDYFRKRPNPENPISALANEYLPGEFTARMIRDQALFVRNNQVNLLACGGDSDEPDERDLALAVRRMKNASFLGVVDCFEQSTAAGSGALRPAFPELNCARPAAVNVSKGMEGTVASRTAEWREACDPDVFDQLLRMTDLDRCLVEAARKEVQQRTDAGWFDTGAGDVPKKSIGMVRRAFPGLRLRALFDSDFYLRNNPDVREAGIPPLRHYLRNGAAEDRAPHLLFDPRYYRATLKEPLPSNANPLLHFLDAGASAASPHPLFNCEAYRAAHPEILARNHNPLVHYLQRGGFPNQGSIEIRGVGLNAECLEDADGVTHWKAEPQQLPFLRALSIDQIRANSR